MHTQVPSVSNEDHDQEPKSVWGSFPAGDARNRDLDYPAVDMYFADDSIQLIFPKMFHQFMLPVYQKPKSGVTTADRSKVHLFRDASHHFLSMKEEVDCYEYRDRFSN